MTGSVLSVYLLHCNNYAFTVFKWLENALRDASVGDYGVFVALAACAFIAGFILDVPRRVLAWLVVGRWWKR